MTKYEKRKATEEAAEAIRERWTWVGSQADERGRRLFVAGEVMAYGHGGQSLLALITGMARSTIRQGIADLLAPPLPTGRIRRKGGGRRRLTDIYPKLLTTLKYIVEPVTRGDPMKPLRWVSKSLAKLARALAELGFPISPKTVANLLKELLFSRQVNRRSIEGKRDPDRNQQFEYIQKQLRTAERKGQPAVSIDSKKRETIGLFHSAGSDYRPQGDPIRVKDHDFPERDGIKVTPYAVFCMSINMAWVSVGISANTAEFAVETIRRWHRNVGKRHFPGYFELTVTADSGGSNGSRVRLFKAELQKLADELRIRINVHHYPPGTSKYNKVEHQCLCHISQNWRGEPLEDIETVVQRIRATTTEAGLEIKCAVDRNTYLKGIEITKEEMDMLNIKGHEFRPDWNYTISPRV